jgi:Ca-activated chloride channel family protein
MILNNSKKNILALFILFVLMGCTQNSKLSEWNVLQTEENRKASVENISVMTGEVDYVSFSHIKHSFSSKNIMNMNYAYSLERENYAEIKRNGLVVTKENPVSTFSIDVDTASYANVRRLLNEGTLPRKDMVRIEEMVNYFDYGYPLPEDDSHPFSVTHEIGPSPWNPETHLLHVGLQGYEKQMDELPPANLVFLIDVSGSMQMANKLSLVKRSLELLVNRLRSIDQVSIVVYAGASGVVLEPTAGNNKVAIRQALDALEGGGSTNGGEGIKLAYDLAQQSIVKDGINRVILATDGDFNVGATSHEELIELIEKKRNLGISLTTLGFGSGNYNDHLMEQLADKGNGNYAYIDGLREANKVLVNELGSTLFTIAKDVKIQIEFNPAVVAEYRLIGYENRALENEDFSNDKVDAGEIGAGHSVTAIYEIALVGGKGQRIEPLRYGNKSESVATNKEEIAHLRVRYKAPESEDSTLLEEKILTTQIQPDLNKTSDQFRLSAAVSAFGEILTNSQYLESYTMRENRELLLGLKMRDESGDRGELLQLIRLYESLGNKETQENKR